MKLAAPLCFNFCQLIDLKSGTQFNSIMGLMDPMPIIGPSFQKLFPATLLVLCLINFFDVWSKFMRLLGLEELTFSEFYEEEKAEEGKRLVQIERQAREGSGTQESQDRYKLSFRKKYDKQQISRDGNDDTVSAESSQQQHSA
mmetsp:Transcript_14808/g.10705  ORF Transcript_14808/g.10705 Transcript_14808/m.10705 type:complete len:143 (+) Transcript_14808:1301-1729(+)|eukprot:CAMPEP_0202959246 /NCGR_PEP_ID=MMETSP1396-20130829/3486_1 /ASSEMBLY_ACC=CAM_ASM_000872 /TAXON_ID= /ORGANISM="Pseudokeronopsis sp., Strain Brazil" /LENGTH=142 /DNA_ID=CAMNT_0049677731 /DNA_START=1300 /DNA_END=1728 /DNA_ORIENTATION=-